MRPFKETKNYIGNAPWQMNITNYIFIICSALNKAAYHHDNDYWALFKLDFKNALIAKLVADFLFLIRSIGYGVIRIEPQSILLGMLAYIVLLISTLIPKLWYKKR